MSADPPRHVAIDLGASGGRVAVGQVRDGRLEFAIVHRFAHRAVPLGRHLYWDLLGIWREISDGLARAAASGPVATIGVTTWGVDYALLDADGLLIDLVHSYRDRRTDGILARIEAILPLEELYRRTGVPFLPLNTLPHLLAAVREAPGLFERARRLLMLPDLLNLWLCGVAAGEHTNASTTQLYDPVHRCWDGGLCARFGVPASILPDLVEPGTVLGPVLPEIADGLGLQGAIVVAPATHDTASAVAAVPAEGEDWAYVSSGTWCLVGVELPRPVIAPAGLAGGVTNEQGLRGTTRLLKNTSGLFILQECLRGWGDPPVEAVLAEAEHAIPAASFDVNDPVFLRPGADMTARIAGWWRAHGRPVSEDRAAIVAAILVSLAEAIAASIGTVAAIAGRRPSRVHLVGGGARIPAFAKAIGAATGVSVAAGPVEATTIGNLLIQAAAIGRIGVADIRSIVRRSQGIA